MVSSNESCEYGSFAHLINFKGTDSLLSLYAAKRYYGTEYIKAGGSIVATEHASITSWGKDHEVDAYRALLKDNPNGIIACVSDSYNIFQACSEFWGGVLRNDVLSRNGTLVIRPDSGEIIPTVIKVLDILTDKFGFEVNSKGYKVLPAQVRVIQGDGVTYFTIGGLLTALEAAGYSSDNVGFGSGGGLLQSTTRETQSFAFKNSSDTINGVETEVYKEPIGDPGKNSLRGKLALVQRGSEEAGTLHYQTIKQKELVFPDKDLLQTVFLNGTLTKEWTLPDLRDEAQIK
jgi:nicotinamide phosphoribosyltransferase